MARKSVSIDGSEEFYLHPRHERTLFRGTIIDGRRVNLTGKDYIQKVPAGPNGPETEILWKGATSEDLKLHAEKGSQKLVLRRNVSNTSSDTSDQ